MIVCQIKSYLLISYSIYIITKASNTHQLSKFIRQNISILLRINQSNENLRANNIRHSKLMYKLEKNRLIDIRYTKKRLIFLKIFIYFIAKDKNPNLIRK